MKSWTFMEDYKKLGYLIKKPEIKRIEFLKRLWRGYP